MESLSVHSNLAAFLRPANALQGDLAAVLTDGRVVAGEVVQGLEQGRVLVSLGRHRVPADVEVPLQPGDRFLARVARTPDGRVALEILGGEGREAPLVAALRAALGSERPLGELLGELARALGGGERGAGAPAGLGLRLGPELDGAALARALEGSGRAFEGWLLTLAYADGPAATLRAALVDTAHAWLASVVRDAPGLLEAALAEAEAGLRRLSRELASGTAGREAALGRLAEVLRGALLRLPDGAARSAWLAALSAGGGRALAGEAGLLLRLLGGRRADRAEALARIAGDAKGRLLAGLDTLHDEGARGATRRALAGIEAEQLLNLVREEAGEGRATSFVASDGGRWATVRLFERRGSGRGRGARPARSGFEVSLSGLGPVRAELLLKDDGLRVVLEVERPEVARRIEEDRAELERGLPSGGRPVAVDVRVGERSARPEDLELLGGRSLMDVEG